MIRTLISVERNWKINFESFKIWNVFWNVVVTRPKPSRNDCWLIIMLLITWLTIWSAAWWWVSNLGASRPKSRNFLGQYKPGTSWKSTINGFEWIDQGTISLQRDWLKIVISQGLYIWSWYILNIWPLSNLVCCPLLMCGRYVVVSVGCIFEPYKLKVCIVYRENSHKHTWLIENALWPLFCYSICELELK